MNRRLALMWKKTVPVSFLSTPKYWKLGEDISTSGKGAQGACFYNDAIFFITISSDSSTQYLYKYEVATGTITKLATYTSLGHANSMTYVPTEHAFYVATMDKDIGIAIIDDTSYNHVSSFVIKNPDTGNNVIPYAIAWDRRRNVLYDNRGSFCRVYDASGNYLYRIDFTNYINRLETSGEQGFETDGEYLYKPWANPNYIDVYSLRGNYVVSITFGISTELEEPVYDWNEKFYANVYKSTGKQELYALMFRSFAKYYNMAYTPLSVYGRGQTGGTVTKSGNNEITFVSSAAASWNVLAVGTGYPYGYSYLNGKKCKISYDVERLAGNSGSVTTSIFTTNMQGPATGSDVILQKTKSLHVPESGSSHYEVEFTIGVDFLIPESGQEGTYIGYRIFWYADSGNSCKVKNFNFGVEV